jgi:hypothetical protein
VSNYLSIAFIVLVQLNYAIAPRLENGWAAARPLRVLRALLGDASCDAHSDAQFLPISFAFIRI